MCLTRVMKRANAIVLSGAMALAVTGSVFAGPLQFQSYDSEITSYADIVGWTPETTTKSWNGDNPFSQSAESVLSTEGIMVEGGAAVSNAQWDEGMYSQYGGVFGRWESLDDDDRGGSIAMGYGRLASDMVFEASEAFVGKLTMQMYSSGGGFEEGANNLGGQAFINGILQAEWDFVADGGFIQIELPLQENDVISLVTWAQAGVNYDDTDRRDGYAESYYTVEFSTLIPLPSAGLAGLLGFGGIVGMPRRRRFA